MLTDGHRVSSANCSIDLIEYSESFCSIVLPFAEECCDAEGPLKLPWPKHLES